MRYSLIALSALIALVFVLIAGQSYIDMDRKFTVVREMSDGLAVVSDRDGRLFFRLQNDAACGGDKYFYDDDALYSKHDGTDEPGTLTLSNILDLNSLKVIKFYHGQRLITLEDKVYQYSIVPMHCCFNLFADKK
jgi:hypothetical protein